MKLKQKLQQGFTLIELMIVVAIVGVLAAVALPSYNDYATRARMTEVLVAAAPCKLAIAEWVNRGDPLPTANSSGAHWSCGENSTGPVGRMVQKLTTDEKGTIILTVTAAATGTSGQTVRFKPCTSGTATTFATTSCTEIKENNAIAIWLCGPGDATGANGVDENSYPKAAAKQS